MDESKTKLNDEKYSKIKIDNIRIGKIRKSKAAKHILIILIYLLITLIISYPLIFNFTTSYVGGGDNKIHMWNMWYVQQALLNEDIDLFYTDHAYYPHGTDLTYHISYGLLNSLLAFPLLYIFDLNVVYNLIWIFAFVASAYTAFLLSYYFTKKYIPSFVGGVIFGFCQYRMIHGLGHLAAINSFTLPLFVLVFLISMKKFKKSTSLWVGVILVIAGLTDLHYPVFLLFFMITFLIYNSINNKRYILKEKRLISLTISAICFLLLISPILVPLVNSRLGEDYATSPMEQKIIYSADVLSFFSIFDSNPIYGKMVGDFFKENFRKNNELYKSMGYTAMFILLFWLIIKKKYKYIKRNPQSSKNDSKYSNSLIDLDWKFWLITMFVFIILSLGPYLKIMGNYKFNLFGGDIIVILPYYLFSKLPFFDVMRTIGRMAIMAILAEGVLISLVLTRIFANWKIYKKMIISFIVVILFISESIIMLPYITLPASTPEIFLNISNDNSNYSVLNLPFSCDDYCLNSITKYHREQTILNKKMLGGHFARSSIKSVKKTHNDPLINSLAHFYFTEEDNINLRSFYFKKSIKENNLGYIILHKKVEAYHISEEITEMFKLIIETYLPTQLYYEDESRTIYLINQSKTVKEYKPQKIVEIDLGKPAADVFLKRVHEVEEGYRWSSPNSTITIPIMVNKNFSGYKINLSSNIPAYGNSRMAKIFVNGELIDNYIVDPEQTFERNLFIPKIKINDEELIINIVVDPPFIPIKDLPGSEDRRTLGVPLSFIKIELT